MFKIVNNERLSDNMFRVTFEAPLVARKAQPGQFLMFRVDEFGERAERKQRCAAITARLAAQRDIGEAGELGRKTDE